MGEWFGKNCTAVPTVAPSVSTKVMSDCNRVDNRLLSSSDEHTEETIDQTITGGQSVSDLATSLVDSESELAPRVRFATERQERQTRQPWRQYHDAYSFRLLKLRDATLSQARALWEGSVSAHGFLQEIRHFRSASGREVVLTGVLYRSLRGRASVLEHFRTCGMRGLHPLDKHGFARLCTDSDEFYLEDVTCRVRLQLPEHLVAAATTGLVVSARGVATSEGDFQVAGLCLAQTPILLTSPVKSPELSPGVGFLALVSGLAIGSAVGDSRSRDRLIHFLSGRCVERHLNYLSLAVKHLVLCGGTFPDEGVLRSQTGVLQDIDLLLTRLSNALPTDLMPGRGEPTNLTLPQMPLHTGLLVQSSRCAHFRSVGNPYAFNLGDLIVMGHSGQPVEDILRCSMLSTPLDALTMSLEALHLAPTAPDTLETRPIRDSDPFLIAECPNVLFSGGHEQAEHVWHASPVGDGGTLCVCVPAFHRQPSVVLVNIHNTRDVRVLEFK